MSVRKHDVIHHLIGVLRNLILLLIAHPLVFLITQIKQCPIIFHIATSTRDCLSFIALHVKHNSKSNFAALSKKLDYTISLVKIYF